MPAFSVTFRAVKIDAAAEMKISPLFEANTGVEGLGFYFDAIATTDFYKSVANPNFPYVLREGNGLRISLLAHGFKVKTAVSFAAVAAEAKLNETRVEYEIIGIGLRTDVIKAILSLKGDLSLELTAQLDEIVSVKLPAMLETASLPAQQFSVPLPPLSSAHEDPEIRARTVSYAMGAIAAGRSLKKATEKRPSWASDAILTATYARMTPGSNYDEPPKTEQQTKANKWLSTGRTS